MNPDHLILKFTYRYEVLLAGTILMLLTWPMYAGTPGFMGAFAVLLVLLDARNVSQYKRQSEDYTMIDAFLSRIPYRYELLVLLALALWLLWWLASGSTGFTLGLGVFALALRARSSSQLKRGEALTVTEASR